MIEKNRKSKNFRDNAIQTINYIISKEFGSQLAINLGIGIISGAMVAVATLGRGWYLIYVALGTLFLILGVYYKPKK